MLAWMVDPSVEYRIRPISRREYDRMVELEIFDEDEHIELMDGVLVQVSPQGWHHAIVIQRLGKHLALSIDAALAVRVQLPFALDEFSEPEPDLAVVVDDSRLREHPDKAFLIVEVAGDSLAYNRNRKLAAYARAGVPEYWIIDLQAMAVEVYTLPSGNTYANKQVLRDGDILRPTKLRGVTIAVADLPR